MVVRFPREISKILLLGRGGPGCYNSRFLGEEGHLYYHLVCTCSLILLFSAPSIVAVVKKSQIPSIVSLSETKLTGFARRNKMKEELGIEIS